MLSADFPALENPLAQGMLRTLGRGVEELGRGLRRWGAEPETVEIPAWDRIRLESRFRPPVPVLELCLLDGEHPLGWTRVEMRSDGSLRWVDPPAGPEWVRDLLLEAVGEWRIHMAPG